ncbi:MAG: OmpA family protein [Bacteroidales bacterium]|nr:OmpA family protein [Bacteroidales bacterium]
MKRTITIVFSLLTLILTANAQVQLNEDNSDYESRFTKLSKAYAKSPTDVEVLFDMAQFYFDNTHPMRNLPMAMKYIQRAEECHITLLDKNKFGELTRLARKNITLTSIRQTKQAICDAAYNTLEVRTDMSQTELDTYLDAFGINFELVRLLRQRRINQVYDEDLKKGTPEAFYHFINNYPNTQEAEQMEVRLSKIAPSLFEGVATEEDADTIAAAYALSPSVQRAAEKQKSRLAYAIASRTNTVKAYNTFLHRYPTSDEHLQARQRLSTLLQVEYASLHTARQYADFIDSNADNTLADSALAQLRNLIFNHRNIEAAQLYIDRYPDDPYYNEVYSRYYAWHAEEGNAAPIRAFLAAHPKFPYKRAAETDLERADQIDAINLMEDFIEVDYNKYASYVRQMMGKRIAFVPLQRMIQSLITSRNYRAALDRIKQFDICFESVSQSEYEELKALLASPQSNTTPTTTLTATYDIQNPSFNAADGRLYYTRINGSSHRICYATKQDGKWTPTGDAPFSNTDNEGLTLFGFFADGTHMLLGSAGDIWIAEKDGNQWRVTDIPPFPVNTDYVETDAYMLPDGSGLLLASDRPNGQNLQPSSSLFHGDTALASDLYFIPITQNGWGTAINLGTSINTPYSERSPILSQNLKTLYFISDGRGGLGYGDIYMATRSNIESWTQWSTPVNIGKEINTGFREASIGFGTDERTLIMTSNYMLGRYSCYSFPAQHSAASPYLTYNLDVLGMNDHLFRVRLADLIQQNITQVVECSGENHSVSLNIHKDKRYAVLGDAGIYFVPAIIIDAHTKNTEKLKGYTFPVLVAMDKPLPLPVIDFEENSDKIKPIAQLQMEQIAQFLNNTPDAVIEFAINVAGHDDTYCYNLSLKRGHALRNKLVLAGIDEARISISAYGNVNAKKDGHSGVSIRFREK